ncbi:MAG: hypothetical protein JWM33_1535 [Caulobacteraceae bacterium]|nr:hypothetical protein [Caulobacteraceae bacterium]
MRLGLLVITLSLLPGLACAAERRFTYDSGSARAKALTGAGLTLTVDQGLLGGAKLKLVQATAVPVAAEIEAAERADEAEIRALLPKVAAKVALYRVDPKAQEGAVLSAAFCPGATRVWLATSPIAYGKPLTLWAVGQGGGAAKLLCAEMAFTWRGEWRLPPDRAPPAIGRPGISHGY